jgi:hypothetical protein
MLRYKDYKKKSGWMKAFNKDLNNTMESGTLNNK